MKNPFTHKLMVYSLQDGKLVNAGAGGEFTQEQADYIAYVFNQHDKLVELAQLAYDVIEDDLEERPARHSLGNLSARLRTILVEENEIPNALTAKTLRESEAGIDLHTEEKT